MRLPASFCTPKTSQARSLWATTTCSLWPRRGSVVRTWMRLRSAASAPMPGQGIRVIGVGVDPDEQGAAELLGRQRAHPLAGLDHGHVIGDDRALALGVVIDELPHQGRHGLARLQAGLAGIELLV